MATRKEIVVQIPEGATNGDAIKALFPNGEWKLYINNKDMIAKVKTPDGALIAFSDWWKAPYKKE